MMRARPAGDAALLVEAAGLAPALATALHAKQFPGVLDAVPGAGTVLVTTEPGSWDLAELARVIGALPLAQAGVGQSGLTEIPVVYDGADLAEVARLTGLEVSGVIAAHQAAQYTVGWLGFSPGFAYLTGLDPVLQAVRRLERPRLSVPAGSVAIAGGLAAVYPAAAPGGWRLLGRTSLRLWDAGREPPALLAPGMRVRFRAVPPGELAPPGEPHPAGGLPPPGEPPPSGEPGRVSVVATESRPRSPGAPPPPAEPGRVSVAPAESRPRSGRPGTAGAVIEVIRPGPLATIQDLGRAGHGHLGVPASGAADTDSLRLANRLAGNPDSAAGIEFTLGRARLRFLADSVVAVTGAPARLTVSRGPAQHGASEHGAAQHGSSEHGASEHGAAQHGATERSATEHGASQHGEPASFGAPFLVSAGSVLRVGSPAAGLRSYLAVSGGIDVPAVLGSRSSDLLSGLGPAPLRAGDLLQAGTRQSAARLSWPGRPGQPGHPGYPSYPGQPLPGTRLPPSAGAALLRVTAGPRDDWFTADALRLLADAPYTVTAASNRTGLRLDGAALPRARGDELPSEGMVTGSLQVPPDGMPILLLADHPVTGGYPVIAVVRSADIGLAAQLRPGQLVRFALSR